MSIPADDAAFLADRGIVYDVVVEGGMTCVVFPNWPLPDGYDRASADLLLRLPAGYPDLAPDMWWFDPAVHLANGAPAQATEVFESHLGRVWQRWSRHLASQWQSGIDGLESYLRVLEAELERSAMEPVH